MKINEFSKLNLSRCLRWHPQGIESWSASDWMTALVGEVGEAANIVKKLNRVRDSLPGNGDLTITQMKAMLADELGDVFAYLDLLATSQGLDLQTCVADKFNRVSDRVNFPERFGMTLFYVMNNGAAWFVKEAEFFKAQGGLSAPWGKSWRPIFAMNIDDARTRATSAACYPVEAFKP